MKVGDKVALFSHTGFRRVLTISEVGVSSGINSSACYKTSESSVFYMKPELFTRRHYNVGNKAFWIVKLSNHLSIMNKKRTPIKIFLVFFFFLNLFTLRIQRSDPNSVTHFSRHRERLCSQNADISQDLLLLWKEVYRKV